jgi:hypothetical protein
MLQLLHNSTDMLRILMEMPREETRMAECLFDLFAWRPSCGRPMPLFQPAVFNAVFSTGIPGSLTQRGQDLVEMMVLMLDRLRSASPVARVIVDSTVVIPIIHYKSCFKCGLCNGNDPKPQPSDVLNVHWDALACAENPALGHHVTRALKRCSVPRSLERCGYCVVCDGPCVVKQNWVPTDLPQVMLINLVRPVKSGMLDTTPLIIPGTMDIAIRDAACVTPVNFTSHFTLRGIAMYQDGHYTCLSTVSSQYSLPQPEGRDNWVLFDDAKVPETMTAYPALRMAASHACLLVYQQNHVVRDILTTAMPVADE